MEHTPGPWDVVEDASDFEASGIKQSYPVVYIIPAKKRNSAITELMGASAGNLDEIRANARLIAGAPQLLRALEDVAAQRGDWLGAANAAIACGEVPTHA